MDDDLANLYDLADTAIKSNGEVAAMLSKLTTMYIIVAGDTDDDHRVATMLAAIASVLDSNVETLRQLKDGLKKTEDELKFVREINAYGKE